MTLPSATPCVEPGAGQPLGALAAEEAQRWLGTRYRHQASLCGVGCDCLGLIRGVWRRLYGADPGGDARYSADWSEPSREERLWRAAEHLMTPKLAGEPLEIGDVLLFRMRSRGAAKHLGVMVAPTAFVHAHSRRGVVRTELSQPWRRRCVGVFRWPPLRDVGLNSAAAMRETR